MSEVIHEDAGEAKAHQLEVEQVTRDAIVLPSNESQELSIWQSVKANPKPSWPQSP